MEDVCVSLVSFKIKIPINVLNALGVVKPVMDLVLMTVYPVKNNIIDNWIKKNAIAVKDFTPLWKILKYVNPVIKLVQDAPITIIIHV